LPHSYSRALRAGRKPSACKPDIPRLSSNVLRDARYALCPQDRRRCPWVPVVWSLHLRSPQLFCVVQLSVFPAPLFSHHLRRCSVPAQYDHEFSATRRWTLISHFSGFHSPRDPNGLSHSLYSLLQVSLPAPLYQKTGFAVLSFLTVAYRPYL